MKNAKHAKGAFKSVNGGITVFETRFPRASQKSPWPCGPSPFGKGDNSFSILSLAYPLADVGCYAVHGATDPRRIQHRRTPVQKPLLRTPTWIYAR